MTELLVFLGIVYLIAGLGATVREDKWCPDENGRLPVEARCSAHYKE